MRRLVLSGMVVAALVAASAAFAAPASTTMARLISVTSPAARNSYATLAARVVPASRCTIAVLYKSGPSHAQGLNPRRPVNGRVFWTWKVGGNTTIGRWPIRVNCGSAGAFHTYFRVVH
jgi:micrococcal nuclease